MLNNRRADRRPIAFEAAEGPEEGVLDDILRRIGISAQEAREIIGAVEMRHHRLLKPLGSRALRGSHCR